MSSANKSVNKSSLKREAKQTCTFTSVVGELLSLLLLASSSLVAISLYSHYFPGGTYFGGRELNLIGSFGETLSSSLVRSIGITSITIVFYLLALSICAWKYRWELKTFFVRCLLANAIGYTLLTASLACFLATLLGYRAGGFLGKNISSIVTKEFNFAGALLIFSTAVIISLWISTGISPARLVKGFANVIKKAFSLIDDSTYTLSEIGRSLRIFFVSIWQMAIKGFGVLSLIIRVPTRLFLNKTLSTRDEEKPTLRKLPDYNEEEERDWSIGGNEGNQPLRRKQRKATETPNLNYDPVILRGETGIVSAKVKPLPTKTALRKLGKKTTTIQEKYQYPSIDTFVGGKSDVFVGAEDAELKENCRKLQQALHDFRIGGKIVEVQPGPVITLYQFRPAPGVKANRVINLADDLALALKVSGVRVYAPVPGQGTVGIEVPNSSREIVRLRDVLDSEEFANHTEALTLALGKDTFGNPAITDLARMPHLLIAGATGTGKSVCINAILSSLLFRNSPEDLRLLLIDPKMLELSIYDGIPHLKAPVVTNPKRARGVLWWAVEEMERRYSEMKRVGVRNLAGYNNYVISCTEKQTAANDKDPDKMPILLTQSQIIAAPSGESIPIDEGINSNVVRSPKSSEKLEKLPRIVIVVDELADLMLTVGREIEELLTRLAQKARASGIHLILATQRPSVNVITGLIKANFPARLSFKVASRIDARTVMDNSGAECLLGNGDSLFLSPITGRVMRMHGAFVSDQEVFDLVLHLKAQGSPDYDPEVEAVIEKLDEGENSGSSVLDSEEDYDPLYDQAVSLVVEKGQASTSMVQRIFRIGYNRAARMLEVMEKEGVVGPADGAKPRRILVGPSAEV